MCDTVDFALCAICDEGFLPVDGLCTPVDACIEPGFETFPGVPNCIACQGVGDATPPNPYVCKVR